MIDIQKGLGRSVLVAAFCLAPFAYGQTATLQHTGGGVNPGFGPYLVGPYNLLLNGNPVSAICDDIAHTIPGSAWTAQRRDITLGGLVGARYFDGTTAALNRYFQVAYLSQQLLDAVTNTVRGYIQWAIWDIFNPGSIAGFSTAIQNSINAYKTDAAANATAAHAIGWSVYTPVGLPNSQEFLIKTPEPAALAILALNLIALVGVILFLRRRLAAVGL